MSEVLSGGDPILEVRGLKTAFGRTGAELYAVNDVDLTIRKGETLAVVGESGSGKSMLAYSIMGLVQSPGRIVEGSILLNGRDLAKLDEEDLRAIRGREIGIIFQEPSTSLNPLMTVGRQVAEVILEHKPETSTKAAMDQVVERFRLVGIPAPEARVHEYPHQLSGGMRQRVMIAMALACRPQLLIADEPTTALDVTVQAQVLKLIGSLRASFGMAVIMITHDLGIVADQADRVVVMYAGRKVEEGATGQVLEQPGHPYTRALMECRPRLEDALAGRPLLEISGTVPSLDALPPGCAFADRCPRKQSICHTVTPPLVDLGSGHEAACHFATTRPSEPR